MNTGFHYDPTDKLAASRRLRDLAESRISSALLALDPGYREVLRLAGEAASLRMEVDRLRAELLRVAPVAALTGPAGRAYEVSRDGGATWEVVR